MHLNQLCSAVNDMEVMQNIRTLCLISLKGIILTGPNTNKTILLMSNPHRGAQCQILAFHSVKVLSKSADPLEKSSVLINQGICFGNYLLTRFL